MDITDDVVDIFLVDDKLTEFGIDEFALQFFYASADIDCNNFLSRHQALADLDRGQRQGRFKKFFVEFLVIIRRFPVLLEELFEVEAGEGFAIAYEFFIE